MHCKPLSAVLLLISILSDPPFRQLQPEPNPYGETPNQETHGITKKFEMAGAKPYTWNKSGGTMFSMHARVFKDGTARNDSARQPELHHEQLLGQANGNQELDHDRGNIAQQQPRQQHQPHHLQQQLHEPPHLQQHLFEPHHLQQQVHEPHHLQEQHQQLPQAQGDLAEIFQYQQQQQQSYHIHHNNIREYQPHNYPLPPHNGQYQPYYPVDQNPNRRNQTNLLNNTQENHRQLNFQNHAQPNLPHFSQPYHPNNQHHNPIHPTHPNNQQNHHNTQIRLNPDLPNHDQPHYHDPHHHHNPLGPLNNVQQNSHQDSLQGNAAAHPNHPHGRYVYDVDYLRWWHAQMYPSHSPSPPNPRDEL